MTYQTMTQTENPVVVLLKIPILHFILPTLLVFGISEIMREEKWIKSGDMKLDI